jgi:glycosyltransferase involved in cell wall biosynthesis
LIIYTNPPILPFIGYLIKKITKNKFIFVCFDLYPDIGIETNSIKRYGFIHMIMNFINKKVYKHADIVVALSDDMRKVMLNNFGSILKNEPIVIHNWFTGSSNDNKNYNDDYNFRDDYKFVVLYSGNFGEAQDLNTIIDAIVEFKNQEILQDILFIFSGYGVKLKYMKDIFEKNNIKNIKIFNYLSENDYESLLNFSDICIVTLEKGLEGLGVPSRLYGYLAYGKPIISIMHENTEISKLVKRFNAGFTMTHGDIKELKNFLMALLLDSSLINLLSENATSLYKTMFLKINSLEKYHDVIKFLSIDGHKV